MRRNLAFIVSSILLASCGGSDDDNNDTYTVSATVAGLQAGATVVLSNNGTNSTPVSANGTISFSTALSSGAAYSVEVATQPVGAACTVANGSGTIGSANVNVAVTCSLNSYSIGGTVSGLLAGNSVTLQNNGANDAIVSADGAFTFSSAVLSGSAYAVTVSTQPPGQSCVVTNGSGTVAGSDISNVAVNCSALAYDVGVTVLGPPSVAGLVVQNNGGDDIAVPTGGTYTFQAKVPSGSPYAVTIHSQPASQTCLVINGSGTVSDRNVNVAVACPWHIAYVAERGTTVPAQTAIGKVSAYYMDATTGALSPVAGSPFTAGNGPTDIKVDPTGKFVYVTNFYSGNVSGYAIDPTSGALTEVAGSPFASGTNQGGMAIDPSGQFAYVADAVADAYGYSIDTATGALTGMAGSPFTNLSPDRGGTTVAVDPSGGFAYVGIFSGLSSSDKVVTAAIDPSSGALTASSTINNGGNNSAPTGITVDPTGTFVYVTDHQGLGPIGAVRGYTRDGTTGALTAMAGSPFAIGLRPSSFAIRPDSKFAYVPTDDAISVFRIDGSSGELTEIAGSPFGTPDESWAPSGATTIAIDPSGAFATATRSGEIAVYRIDSTTGALTEVAGSPFAEGTNSTSIAIK